MGFFLGLLSSATFGLIPLFTLPLLQAGISAQTALVYRFAIAAIVMGAILYAKGEKLAVNLRDLLKLVALSCMYLFAVVLFFYAFSFMASGVVATIQFLYPVMVMLIMILFFHEQFHWHIAIALLLAVLGVALLSCGPDMNSVLDENVASSPPLPFGSKFFWGVTLSLLAGLCNALYFVGIQVARLPAINGLLMTFYVMATGTVFCLVYAVGCDSLQWIGTWREFGIAALLAIVTAVISNLTLIMSIKSIGSTLASILGVMEPVTAVVVGVLVFGEPFTKELTGGVVLIIASVLLVLIGPKFRLRRKRA